MYLTVTHSSPVYIHIYIYADRVSAFELPSLEEIKAILYANDVGYKSEEGKLFIRRHYKLPMLLFPKETFTTTILADEGICMC
jgi:hypothetical protein